MPKKRRVGEFGGQMATQKNQHYVPQFYQRRFSPDGKTIGSYIFEQDKQINQAPIKHQASKDYFYTKETEQKNNVEESLGKLEAMTQKVMEKVDANPCKALDKIDESTLYVFTILQLGRTVAHANIIQSTADTVLKQLMKEEFLHRQSVNKKLSEEEIDMYCLRFPSLGGFSLGIQAQMIPTCVDLEQKLSINNTGYAFVTSDNPAVLYNMFFERMGLDESGMGCRGVFVFMPLSPELAIVLYDGKVYKIGNKRQSYAEITNKRDVEELNKLTAVNAFQAILYNPKVTTVDELSRLAHYHKKYAVENKVIEIKGVNAETGNTILGVHQIGIMCGLQLSFVKYLPIFAAKTPQNFDPFTDRFREIAQYKDEIINRFNKKKIEAESN